MSGTFFLHQRVRRKEKMGKEKVSVTFFAPFSRYAGGADIGLYVCDPICRLATAFWNAYIKAMYGAPGKPG